MSRASPTRVPGGGKDSPTACPGLSAASAAGLGPRGGEEARHRVCVLWLVILWSRSQESFVFCRVLIVDIFFPSVSEEAIEDVEGPSEAAADPEEVAKDPESGGEKDQSKWTGSVCGCPGAPCSSRDGGGCLAVSRCILKSPRKPWLCARWRILFLLF